jgi:hypothetical protein
VDESVFFFEKKNQKTFAIWGFMSLADWRGVGHWRFAAPLARLRAGGGLWGRLGQR